MCAPITSPRSQPFTPRSPRYTDRTDKVRPPAAGVSINTTGTGGGASTGIDVRPGTPFALPSADRGHGNGRDSGRGFGDGDDDKRGALMVRDKYASSASVRPFSSSESMN